MKLKKSSIEKRKEDEREAEGGSEKTHPELSKGLLRGFLLQLQELGHVGQGVFLDAVEHNAGQPRDRLTFLRFFQKACDPDERTSEG